MSRDNQNGFEDWGGYMEAKVAKLEEQFAASSEPFRESNLFAGISIYVNGLTNPSSEELKRIMMINGGTYHHYERSHTTYIIASNLPDVKIRNWKTNKVVRPEWVVDCLKAKRLVDYSKYLLCTNQKTSQPRLKFVNETEATSSHVSEKVPVFTPETDTALKNRIKHSRLQIGDHTAKSDPSSTSAALTAVDPKFLAEFYNNSRLHHIATLGAGFKQYIHELRASHCGIFSAREKIRSKMLDANVNGELSSVYEPGTWIMHIDIDCFFVSVGLRKMPHMRGLPVAVTHSKAGGGEISTHPQADRELEMELFAKRFENHLHSNILSDKARSALDNKMSLSEIASCSYEARSKGIRNGMFVGQALKLCPELRTIPYDFEGYKEVAYALYDTIAQYTLEIEAVSCDEMFVDLTDVLKDLNFGAMDFVRLIREEVRAKTSCPCSAGVGANKLQARMATKRAKPDGQYQLDPSKMENYMAEIPISDLPGVGSSISHTLKRSGISTCGDLQQISLSEIQMHVGKKFGQTLHNFCRGIDNRPLIYGQIRKSVSAEVNYGIRFSETKELVTFLRQLCLEVHARLLQIKRKTKCVTLKIMVRAKEAPVETSKFMGHGVCDHITKSVSLSEYTCDPDTITRTVLTTMRALDVAPNELRGIGIQLSKLDEPSEKKKDNVLRNMFTRLHEQQKFRKKLQKQKSPSPASHRTPQLIQQTKNGHKKEIVKKCNIIGILKNAKPVNRTNQRYDLNTIDSSVLGELPEDIRQEILHEQLAFFPQNKSLLNEQTCESKVDMDFNLKKILPQEVVNNNPNGSKNDVNSHKSVVSKDNIFIQEDCKRLLLNWIKSCPSPDNLDVDLISEHARELVRSERIHDLYDSLVFLSRIITKQKGEQCSWHNACNVIIDSVQSQMRQTYRNYILFFSEKISCSKCHAHT